MSRLALVAPLALLLACFSNGDDGSGTAASATSGDTSTSTSAASTTSGDASTSAGSSGGASSGSSGGGSSGGSSGATTSGGGSSTGGPETSGGATSSGGEATTTTTGGVDGLAEVGALVVLGDSISDGGGQPPYYYNLLRADLEAHYGPITYANAAQSGSKTGALLGQAKSLPGSLPGPVVAVITSGGNDMKAALPQVILGTDGPVKAEVAANIDAALGELLAPGRFGPGVEVFVFEGNIYDASDGMGNFSEGKCAFGNGLPPIPTDAFFDAWNGVIADAVEARGEAAIDMHGYFYDHGYNNPPNWYASDCTHPSMLGHDQLRRLFYEAITGEALP